MRFLNLLGWLVFLCFAGVCVLVLVEVLFNPV